MNDAERIEINNIAVSIMEDSLYPKERFEVAKRIYDLTKDPRPDWTPCAEGFPTVKETVLATIADGFGNDIMLAWYDGDSWQDGYKNKIPVIAWQPLPAPYNPDRKEEHR